MLKIKNLLNLKRKDPSDVIFVEKVVLKDRSVFFELFRIIVITAVTSGIVWGISNADTILNLVSTTPTQIQSFSTVGVVTEIATTTISIGSIDSTTTTNTFDTSNVISVQTNHFNPLSLSDISVGDNIILQGTEAGDVIKIFKIFSYGTNPATGILEPGIDATTTVATTTATTTDATTTDATTTDATTTDATTQTNSDTNLNGQATSSSTTSSTATSTGIIDSIINTVKDTFQNIIDNVSGTSTGTTTDPVQDVQTVQDVGNATSTDTTTPTSTTSDSSSADSSTTPTVTPSPTDTTSSPPTDSSGTPAE